MSNIILPQKYENKLLEANLQAFFKRYPYERNRLENLLTRPVGMQPAVKIDLPAVPSQPPMRVLLVAGINSPQFLCDVLNDATVREDCFQLFVIENNEDQLAFYFQNFDLTQLINHPKTEWLLLQSGDIIKSSFFRTLKREHVAALMKNVHILETALPQPEEVAALYKQIPAIYDETVYHVLHNFGRIDDSLEGVKATLMNKEVILNHPGIEDLKGSFKNIPALIVGAGPSLDKHLEAIKKNNDKFVVIAADAALKPLLKVGIRVDYCTSIERLNDYQKPFFDNLEPIETELVAFPVVLPSQFSLFPGKIRLVYRNYSYFAYFEKSWPKGILKCGGSTAHLAVRLADWMGCSRIFLVGIDSSYEKQEGSDLYRSHCSNTGHAEWGEFIELKDFHTTRRHLPAIVGTSNAGQDVMTNMTYYQWAKEYTEELAEVGARIPIINCSETGLKIEGIEYKSFTESVERFDDRTIEKPKQPQTRFNRTFTHKLVAQHIDSWLKICNDCINECEQTLDIPRFEAVMFIYNFRVAVDAMFVSFVVQNCAKEFFELENRWWSLNKIWTEEMDKKVLIMKERFQLFKEVLEKLQTILKETGNG